MQHFDCEDTKCVVGEKGRLREGSSGIVRLGFHKVLGPVAVKCISHKDGSAYKDEAANK